MITPHICAMFPGSQVPRVSVLALPPVSSAVEGIWPENLDHDGFHWTGPRENLKETMCFSMKYG